MCSCVYNFIKKNFVKLLLLLLITACDSNQHPVPRCVPAELFADGTTTSVSAYFDKNADEFIADDKKLGNVIENDQVVRWKYTGYITNGKPIVLKAEGMWTSWVKDNNAPEDRTKASFSDDDVEFYEKVLSTERVCGPYTEIKKNFVASGKKECEVSCKLISGVKDDTDKGRYGPPCWFKNGYGAYLLFKRPNDPEPNETLDYMRYPVSPVLHIGYTPLELGGENNFSSQGNKIIDHLCNEIKLDAGWKIYIKILDRHYYDNVGGYAITFIEGIDKEVGSSPFEWVRQKIRGELDKAGQQLFERIVGNPVFKNFVFSVLTLFLIFGSLAYIFGMVQSPFGDVIVRILKVSLIMLLISPSSWDFFYNHLLRLFIHGTDQIIAMINSHSTSYKPETPFAFMDDMIVNKVFSPLIWKVKIRALIIANFGSIFAAFVIIIAVLLYVALCMYAFVIYLTAFVGITFLVGLLPLFLLGILFSQFKSLFDGWLTQCISFAMQAILIFTLLSLFGALIMNYYYRIFGFTTCYNEWLKIKICVFSDSLCLLDKRVFGWTPGQYYDPKVLGFFSPSFNLSDYKQSNDQKNPSKARYRFTGGGAYIKVPPELKHEDFRYVDYPFLDPDANSDGDPFGLSVGKNSHFRNLSHYINALLTTDKGYAAARLIENIRTELDKLEKDNHINAESKNKVLKIIDDRVNQDKADKKSALDKFKDQDFKNKIIDSLTTDVIGDAASTPTPQEELLKQYDYNLILRIRAGDIILWSEVGSLFLAALLIWQMRAFIQSVAVSLAGGSMMSQTIASMYEGGFLRIFSEIPVIGKMFEKIDNTIDGWKLWSGNVITKVARAPLNLLHRVPVLGKAVKFTGGATNVLTSSYSEHDRDFNNDFKQLNYVRAFIGAHLGFSPLDAMKYLGGHIAGKMTGTVDGGLIHNMIEDRKAALDSLKAHILGPEQYKPLIYIPNKKDEDDDDSNPFSKASSKNKSRALLDDEGNVFVNKENLKDALEAREQLNTMLVNAKDEGALQKIKYDIDRLDDALRNHLGDNFDTVIGDYAKSYEPIDHPQDLLDADLSQLDASSSSRSGDPLPSNTPHLDDAMQFQSESESSVPLNVMDESVVRPDIEHHLAEGTATTSFNDNVPGSAESSERVLGDEFGDRYAKLFADEGTARFDSTANATLNITEEGVTRPDLEHKLGADTATASFGNDVSGNEASSKRFSGDEFSGRDAELSVSENAARLDSTVNAPLDITDENVARSGFEHLGEDAATTSFGNDVSGNEASSKRFLGDEFSSRDAELSVSEDAARLDSTVSAPLDITDENVARSGSEHLEDTATTSFDGDVSGSTSLFEGVDKFSDVEPYSDKLPADENAAEVDSTERNILLHVEENSPIVEEGFIAQVVKHDDMDLERTLTVAVSAKQVHSDTTQDKEESVYREGNVEPSVLDVGYLENDVDGSKVSTDHYHDGPSQGESSNFVESSEYKVNEFEEPKHDVDIEKVEESNLFKQDETSTHTAASLEKGETSAPDPVVEIESVTDKETDVFKFPAELNISEGNIYDVREIQQEADPQLFKPEETQGSEDVISKETSAEAEDDSLLDEIEKKDDISKQYDERKDTDETADDSKKKVEHFDDSPEVPANMIAQAIDAQDLQIGAEQDLKQEILYTASVEIPKQEKDVIEDKSGASHIFVSSSIDNKQGSETEKVDIKKAPTEKKATSKKKDSSKPSIFEDIKILLNQYGKQMSNDLSDVFDNFFKNRRKQSKEEIDSMIAYLNDAISSLESEKSRLSNSDEIQAIEEKIKSIKSTIASILSNQE